jgi:apolipoprotein N-acyltransferase
MSKKEIKYYWLAGLLLCLMAWPPSPLNFIVLISYFPIYYAFLKIEKTRLAFIFLYSFFFAFLLIKSLSLFAEGEYSYTMLIGLFLAPIFWTLPFIPVYIVKRRFGLIASLFTLVIVVSLHEYWQYYWELSFNWYTLGLSLGSRDLASPLYQLLNVNGVSILILIANSIFVILWDTKKVNRKLRLIIGFSVVLVLSSVSLISLQQDNSAVGESIEIVAFSPTTEEYRSIENNLPAQINYLIERIEEADIQGPNLLVGPESYLQDLRNNPIFVNRLNENTLIKRLQEVCNRRDISMVLGAILVELIPAVDYPSYTAKKKEKGLYFEVYNGSIYLQPSKKAEWRSKRVLLPFTESIPFAKKINQAAKEISWIPRFDNTYGINRNDRPYSFLGNKFISSVCYESLYPHIIEQKNRSKDLGFHLILTNDWTKDAFTIKQYQSYCHAIVKSTGIPAIYVGMDKTSIFLDYPTSMRSLDQAEFSQIQIVN